MVGFRFRLHCVNLNNVIPLNIFLLVLILFSEGKIILYHSYTLYYTLHFKFFECKFYTINYDPCYILHLNDKLMLTWTKIQV